MNLESSEKEISVEGLLRLDWSVGMSGGLFASLVDVEGPSPLWAALSLLRRAWAG